MNTSVVPLGKDAACEIERNRIFDSCREAVVARMMRIIVVILHTQILKEFFVLIYFDIMNIVGRQHFL